MPEAKTRSRSTTAKKKAAPPVPDVPKPALVCAREWNDPYNCVREPFVSYGTCTSDSGLSKQTSTQCPPP